MIIAIDSLEQLNKLKGHQIIFAFDKEPIQELLDTKLHCVYYKEIKRVDINLTKYDIKAKKTTTIDDENLFELPPIKKYKYAIVIPNYNNNHGEYKGKTYLANCIESILNQTYKNFEIIFVDDMSDDNSAEFVESYKDKRIHVIRNIRKRYNGGSRNVGIEYALGLDIDYITFLDSDDWYKHNQALDIINEEIQDKDLALIGCECINQDGVFDTHINQYDNYEEFFMSLNKVYCTAWSRIIKKDKIVFFCEDTLMEDRVWSYKQADNIELDKVVNIEEVLYVWNRLNTINSVSIKRDDFWNASAWCHIGHLQQFITKLKHTEFKEILEERLRECINKANNKEYSQY